MTTDVQAGNTQYFTHVDLRQAIMDAWEIIPQSAFTKLTNSVTDCGIQVLSVKGVAKKVLNFFLLNNVLFY